MPNGGSDCCGTCWFNSKNEGEPGYHGSNKEGPVICQIRNLEIEDPFYTYCINHPHHNPNKIATPLGPVYSGEERQILVPAPDDDETRIALLKLLETIEETPKAEYPFGRGLDEEVITQIGKLDEKRAINSLKKITAFDPLAQPKSKNSFARNRIITVGLAVETLAKLSQDQAIPEIGRLIKLGLKQVNQQSYDPKKDQYAPIRYHAVRALKFCSEKKAIELLKFGMRDPHQEIKVFSKEILSEKIGLAETVKIEKALSVEEQTITKDIPDNDHKPKNKWWEFWKKNK